jgi:hypothetical protein
MLDSSAVRKFMRGVEHAHLLCEETRAFENAKAYMPRVERKQRPSQEIEYRVFAIERQAPPPHWAVLAGDAIQNIRASLDHLVWAKVKRGGPNTAFPVFVDPCEFQVIGKKRVSGAPPAIKAFVEEAQPYKHWPQAPRLDALWQLNPLSNLDKHRNLTTVACTVDLSYAGVPADVQTRWEKYADFEPLSDDAEVAILVAYAGTEAEKMNVKPNFTYQVALEERPLIGLFTEIIRRTWPIVVFFETGQPIGMLDPYPLP